MGSSTFSLPALKLLCAKHEVVCVYTRIPKPSGRGMLEHRTPVHDFALSQNIPVVTPVTLRTENAAQDLLNLRPDVVVVAAYGLILPQAILDVPQYGCINIHGSILPRWRGAAPVHHALLSGDTKLGVTIMRMEAGLDTGPMLKKGQVENSGDFQTIHDAIAELGADLLMDVLDNLETIIPETQSESLATYAHKVTKEDAAINHDMTVEQVLRIIRTFGQGWGGRFSYKDDLLMIHDGKKGEAVVGSDNLFSFNKKLFFKCHDGTVEILSIQKSGKKVITAQDFLNSFQTMPPGN